MEVYNLKEEIIINIFAVAKSYRQLVKVLKSLNDR